MLECTKNYSKTAGSFWNCCRDEPNSGIGGEDNNINYFIQDSKSFDYKTSITGKLENNNTEIENVEVVVPLKHVSNFRKTLDIPLINFKINPFLTWTENCVTTSKATRDEDPVADPAVVVVNNPTNATFKISDTKLYVPVVTLPTQDNNKFLEQLRTGFKRTIKWNKYRSEMTNQTKNNNFSYLIRPTFTKVNRLFVLSFKNEEERTSFSEYYTPNVEIKLY